jgi:CRISPR type IV-associated protein Csf2
MFKVQAKVVSQFAQIESGESDGILLKKNSCYVKNSFGVAKKVSVPILTGNGFRGMLRREGLNLILNTLMQKGLNTDGKNLISTANFNLMNAGGGNDFQSQAYEIEAKVRELNPLISLFGISLAITGKISTPNFQAYENLEEDFYDNNATFYDCQMPLRQSEDGRLFSSIIEKEYFCKKDDMFNGGENTKYLTQEQMILRREEVEGSNAERKKQLANKDDKKEKKKDIRTYLFKEYVPKGVNFYSYIEDINENSLTKLEKGFLILALESLVTKRIGAYKARGFGSFKYDILFDDGSKLSTEVDEITFKATLFREYTKELEECVLEARNWLDNLTEENVKIAEILTQKKEKADK